MTELVELLTEAFEEEPRRPADPELGGGVTATEYWSFAPSLEVVVAESERPRQTDMLCARGGRASTAAPSRWCC